MAEQPHDRLDLLYRISQTFNSSLDLKTVLNRVMDEVIAVTQAERGFLMLRDADGTLTFHAARGIDHQTVETPEFEISRTVVERVATEGEPLLALNAGENDWLSAVESVRRLGLRSVMCVPLHIKENLLGVIYVDNQFKAGLYTPADLDLLAAIGSSAVIAIENARLYEVAVDQGRMERELQVAREVQTSFLPRTSPHLAGWEFAAGWHPAREVSGDFYDFIPVGEGQLGVVIADVSDKGMPAALFMALSRSVVRASVAPAIPPADCIDQANRLICADSTNGMFVSLAYLELSPDGRVTYVNAGHNAPLYYQAATEEMVTLRRTGVVLGLFEKVGYEQKTLYLESGDFILLYTDGVNEAVNLDEQEFGMDRLRGLLIANRDRSAEEILFALETALADHAGTAARFDDITMVLVKRS